MGHFSPATLILPRCVVLLQPSKRSLIGSLMVLSHGPFLPPLSRMATTGENESSLPQTVKITRGGRRGASGCDRGCCDCVVRCFLQDRPRAWLSNDLVVVEFKFESSAYHISLLHVGRVPSSTRLYKVADQLFQQSEINSSKF